MEFFQITSTWLVVLLTWARVWAIIFPLRSLNKNHNRNASITIFGLTCISFLVSLAKLFASGGKKKNELFIYFKTQHKNCD